MTVETVGLFKTDQILRNSVGMVRYEWDDGYLLGKKKKMFQALE